MWHRSCVERFHGEFVERHLYLSSTSPRHLVPKCRELSTWAASFEHVSSFLGDKFSILGKLSTNTWRRDVLCSRRRIFTVDDTIFSSILLFTHDRTHVVTASYHISYFFFYLLLAKGNVGKGLRSQHLLYSFRIFRFAGAPLYWETFIPFHLQISRANFPRSLRYLSKVDKYIILWIIILIRNRFRKSS